MPPIRLRLASLSLALALSGCGESAPPTPVIELSPTADTIATGFAETANAAWLGGDRWAVVAPLDEPFLYMPGAQERRFGEGNLMLFV